MRVTVADAAKLMEVSRNSSESDYSGSSCR